MEAPFHPKTMTRRLFVLTGLALLWVFAIFWRLIHWQVVCHRALAEEARKQQHARRSIPAQRGAIFDRQSRLLAKSLLLDSVSVNPRHLPVEGMAAEILGGALGLDGGELAERIRQQLRCPACHKPVESRRGFLWVKRRLSPAESQRIRSLADHFKWIQLTGELQRYFPNGILASHVVGAVDGDGKGNLGLEQALERELAGQPGEVEVLRDVKEREIDSQVLRPVEHGVNITLALDASIQFVAERELRAAAQVHHARTGSIVVLKPGTGEVLAMASFPTFDPNVAPRPDEPEHIRFNHAFSVPFEPGSVFKIVTVAAALDATDLRPDSRVDCGNGRMSLYGRVIHEAKHGYGVLPVSDVLAHSSNIGAIRVGLRVGDRRLLEYVRRLGFGQRTGLRLPAESSGTVRDLKHWSATSIASVAMGHEISTTTLQLAQACAVIANGGLLVKPRLILRRQRPGEKPVAEPAPPPQRVLKPDTAILMRQMMEGVVLRGTGKKARLDGYSSGGKTGTAQIYDPVTRRYTGRYNASFVGFAPVTNPAVVVAVTLNGVKEYGSVVAAPVFRTVATEALLLMDVPKDLPEPLPEPARERVVADDLAIAELSTPPADLPAAPAPVEAAAVPPLPAPPAPVAPSAPAASPELPVLARGLRAPSFAGMTLRAVLEESFAWGVPVEVLGSGIARAQTPAGGSPLAPGQKVRVEFR